MAKSNYRINNKNKSNASVSDTFKNQDSEEHTLSDVFSSGSNLEFDSDSSASADVLSNSVDEQKKSKKKSRKYVHAQEVGQVKSLKSEEYERTTTVQNVNTMTNRLEQLTTCSDTKVNTEQKYQEASRTYSSTSDTWEEDDEKNEQNDNLYDQNEEINRISSNNQNNYNEWIYAQLCEQSANKQDVSCAKKNKPSKISTNKNNSRSKNPYEKTTMQTETSPYKLPSDLPQKWYRGDVNLCSKSTRGYVLKIRFTNEQAIIKIYTIKNKKRSEDQELFFRTSQEKIALTRIKGMDNVPQFIDSNIPDSIKELSNGENLLWTITSYNPGCTLMKLIEKWTNDNINVKAIESIRFCEGLLKTVRRIHAKGIIHRDIKPANIIVECDKHEATRICSECKTTLIDYGLVHVRPELNVESSEKYRPSKVDEVTLTALQDDIGNKWCRISQMAKASDTAVNHMTDLEKYEKKRMRRSPTIDASSICAILFTLLTKKHPGSTRDKTGLQPHHRHAKELQRLIKDSLSDSDLQKRIEVYLMDTFDKGFGFPDVQWTVEQLEYRLDLITQMMQNKLEENMIEDASGSISKITDEHLIRQSKSSEILNRKADFIKVANAFTQAKNTFIKQTSPFDNLRWSSNTCQWIDDINSLHEKKHLDILTCSKPGFEWSMLVIFHCYIDSCADVIKLSIGTIIDGVSILLPVERFNETVETQTIDDRFCVELNTLIRLLHENSPELTTNTANHLTE